MESDSWDMAVVGAGPAGSVCACSALAASEGIRVALIDRETFPRDKSCGRRESGPDAVSVLRELGLDDVFEGRGRPFSAYEPQALLNSDIWQRTWKRTTLIRSSEGFTSSNARRSTTICSKQR